MIPAVALAVAGAVLAPAVDIMIAVLQAIAVATALYTAHVVDEYVDAHVRGEEAPLLSPTACRNAVVVSSVGFFALAGGLWTLDARTGATAIVPLWLLALLHATVLDTHPVSTTIDYPVGVAVAFVTGYLAQTGRITPGILAIAVALTLSLSATKVTIDRLDSDFDASIGKRTLPVVLGDRSAGRVAAVVHLVTGAVVGGFVTASILPPLALVAAIVSITEAAVVVGADPPRAVRIQMALAYPFTAVLLAAHCRLTDCTIHQLPVGVGLG